MYHTPESIKTAINYRYAALSLCGAGLLAIACCTDIDTRWLMIGLNNIGIVVFFADHGDGLTSSANMSSGIADSSPTLESNALYSSKSHAVTSFVSLASATAVSPLAFTATFFCCTQVRMQNMISEAADLFCIAIICVKADLDIALCIFVVCWILKSWRQFVRSE